MKIKKVKHENVPNLIQNKDQKKKFINIFQFLKYLSFNKMLNNKINVQSATL